MRYDARRFAQRTLPITGEDFDAALATLARLALSDRTWEIFRLFAEHHDPALIRAFYKALEEDRLKQSVPAKASPYSVDTARMYLMWGRDYKFAEELTL